MKRFYVLFLGIVLIGTIVFTGCGKEKGCTDITAKNFSETAEKDDGSCIYNKEFERSHLIDKWWYSAQSIYPLSYYFASNGLLKIKTQDTQQESEIGFWQIIFPQSDNNSIATEGDNIWLFDTTSTLVLDNAIVLNLKNLDDNNLTFEINSVEYIYQGTQLN